MIKTESYIIHKLIKSYKTTIIDKRFVFTILSYAPFQMILTDNFYKPQNINHTKLMSITD